MKKSFGIIIMTVLTATLWSAFTRIDDPKEWKVPEAFHVKKNPIAFTENSKSDGKAHFDLHCASCHGKKGKGDGAKSAKLETKCFDLTSESTQKHTDGDLFYKTLTGHDDMPSFKKHIPEEDEIWSIVNYLRSLKQK